MPALHMCISGPITPLTLNAEIRPLRFVVGGESNRWLNITQTVASNGSEDPDSKIIMCEVCVDRDTESESCHTSNFTLYVIDEPKLPQTLLTGKYIVLHIITHHNIELGHPNYISYMYMMRLHGGTLDTDGTK